MGLDLGSIETRGTDDIPIGIVIVGVISREGSAPLSGGKISRGLSRILPTILGLASGSIGSSRILTTILGLASGSIGLSRILTTILGLVGWFVSAG
ncbi:MAG: hypothetical protein P4L31_04075 [Candidatus Babeliales bacterium]|nr:hypothetical protein [Candidatus Babeliales bacterium]